MKKILIRFLFLNTFFTLALVSYNYIHINMIEYDIKNHYDKIISISNDFYHHYLNVNKETKNAGLYSLSGKEVNRTDEMNNGGFIVTNKSQVPDVEKYIISIKNRLSNFIDEDKIKTLSVLTPESFFFLPFYPEYSALSQKDNLFDITVEKNKFSKSYSESKPNIMITRSYIEKVSLDRLRSIIMPIYIEKKLEAILMIDLYFGHMDKYIHDFNETNYTQYERRNRHNYFTKEIDIPYTKGDLSNQVIGLDWLNVLSISLAFYIFVESIYLLVYLTKNKLASLMTKDSMTNCYRRNVFDIYFKYKCNKSVILLDIDHFKKINDIYGHDIGDTVIKHIAKQLNYLSESNTKVFRWGGEEFLIVLPKLSKVELINKAEQIRQGLQYQLNEHKIVTVSLGVTEQKKDESIYQAIYRADIALYKAKSDGRNQSQYL
ncbi:hypothetical protein VT25_07345 [Photobacterium leiognathi subsp. mandapamensis]|nr:hypothetical protein VT25_07345 [Photobacterium leiognathi subsp. mandapamensis]